MKKLLVAAFTLAAFTGTLAQSPTDLVRYAALTIPDSLKTGADAVYRLDEDIIEVLSPSRYNHSCHQIITLLNKDAAMHLYQSFWFDQFNKIDDIEVKQYNSLGMEVRKYKKKDFETVAYNDHMSLHTDNKVMRLYIPAADYPCTIEIIYTKKISAYTGLPGSVIQSPNRSVENFNYQIKVPKDLDIHYKTGNTSLKPVVTKTADAITYQWKASNLKALRSESESWESHTNYPYIDIAPARFEFDGTKGSLGSWKEFGEWAWPLYEDPVPFTLARINEIKSMVASVTDPREKIKILYQYLQKNNRYVSIQLGIGGFKPFAVSYVEDKKYGDCKALTNYMRYLLKTVDIPSFPALINAGHNSPPVDPAFPANGFNHVILCVPLQKDTVWLECTSNFREVNELGSFTENKNALLLTPQGGKLVSTPKSKSSQNKLITATEIKVDKEGGAEVIALITCTGNFYDYFHHARQLEREELKRFLVQNLDYKSPDDFKFEEINSADKKQFRISFLYDQVYDFKAGNKLFFRPRMYNICDEDIRPDSNRTRDYLFQFPYEKTDTTVYILPENFSVDALPPIKQLETQYGYYRKEATRNTNGNGITIVTQLNLKQHIVPAKEYPALADFFQSVNKTDGARLVIFGE
jgi:hypothetical protein